MKKQNNIFKIGLYSFLVMFSILYALPNFFEKEPAVVVIAKSGDILEASNFIVDNKEKIGYKKIKNENKKLVVIFEDISKQMSGYEVINENIKDGFYKNLNLITSQPKILDFFNAKPANLGLDLRGGVYFLMEVDTEEVEKQKINKIKNELIDNKFKGVRLEENSIKTANTEKAKAFINDNFSSILEVEETEQFLKLKLSELALRDFIDGAIKQNIITLKNRVNEIGVAEPVIQRQGFERIAIQLPGIQDTQKAKEIIGATATLDFKAVKESGLLAEDSEVIEGLNEGEQYVFFKDSIISGESIIDASSGFDPETNTPIVSVQLDSVGGNTMLEYTSNNKGKLMGSVLKTITYETIVDSGVKSKSKKIKQQAINVARIQGTFSTRFQITGINDKDEAHQLAILLKSGALAAPVEIIEERTIGPSLGAENIYKGKLAISVGFVLVLLLMAMRYKTLGLIANFCVLVNMMALLSILSFIGATLTLPGIAGIILTVGMAVDANVVIFERIKEEYKRKQKVGKSIENGYKKAFSSILDANITTFIAALVLFAIGTGAVKGFAVTLLIGLLTSFITSLYLSKIIVESVYKNKKSI